MSGIRVNKYLDDLHSVSPDEVKIIRQIRKIFFAANKDLLEDIKYGGLVFSLSDTLVGGIFLYKKHISIEFSNGADFSDPSGILEGKGKKRRHVKIFQEKDIADKKVKAFVAEAIKAG